ncbi:hypothetical protein ACROYT_G043925 [Oculina patagonica]
MRRRQCSNANLDPEAYDIARGLYDSKVNIKRPPSAAQHGVYTASCRGPPTQANLKPRPISAKARITTERVGEKATATPKPRPPWRPFSGHAALNRRTLLINKDTDNGNTMMEEELHCDLPSLPKVYKDRCLPRGLVFLQEWLTEDVPSDWLTQLTPKHSFVFLPCTQSGECDMDNLPAVPPVQQPVDLLIYTPEPQIKTFKPPKPRFQPFVEDEEMRCKHRRDSMNAKPSQASLHDTFEGMRTADIIRQEIEDLERLLQGIGNPKGSSVVVRYQHDINYLRDMVRSTVELYDFSEEARSLTPVAASFQEDLVRYPEQHDQIVLTIKQRRDQCVRELADIEQEIMNNNR